MTNDDRLAEQVRCLARHGATTRYFSELVGYNTRLDEIQAAILRVKLKRVDEFNASRRDVAARYSATLKDVQGIIQFPIVAGSEHVFHQYTVRLSPTQRDLVSSHLTNAGIANAVYYPTLICRMPAYGGLSDEAFPMAAHATQEVLSLPISPWLSNEEVDEICDVVARPARLDCIPRPADIETS